MTDTEQPISPPAWGAELAAAFAAAQAEMPDITKGRTARVETKTGGSYSYTYADLSDVLEAVRPVLAKHGLFITQDVLRRNAMIDTYTTIGHKSGQLVSFGPMSFEAGGTPQTAGSAVTYARRYALLAALGLATEDDDGQAAANAPKSRRQPERLEEDREPTAGEKLYQRVAQVGRSSPLAAELKALAQENNAKLVVRDFDADPAWAELVTAILDGAA